MDESILNLINEFKLTGNIEKDSYKLLIKHNRLKIAEHSLKVGKMAGIIAKRYGIEETLAETSGYLHDIGGIFPNNRRIEIASTLGIEILQEERKLPLILHQKISRVLVKEIFNIDSIEILNAIECHTTLRANPSKLDMVLFIADKIEWDQNGVPPYLGEIKKALDVSMEYAAFSYIDYLFKNKEKLNVVHPWLLAAYNYLCRIR